MMNYFYSTLVALALLTATDILAQDAGTVEGTIYWKDGTTLNTNIFIPLTDKSFYPVDLAEFSRNSVRYIDENNEKGLITQERLDHFTFEHAGTAYDIHYIEKDYNGIRVLMRLVEDGKAQLFEYHHIDESSNGIGMRDVQYFMCMPERDGNIGKALVKVNFKKKSIEFFEGYPEMQAKVKAKEFKYKNIREMIAFFNANNTQ